MADDSAALVLSLEARFDKFEKAMRDVANSVDKQTKVIEDRFSAMSKVIEDKLGGIANQLSGRLGVVGDLLKAIGPTGQVAAIAIGGLAAAFDLAAKQAQEFGAKMQALRNLSESTSITTDTLQVLRKAATGIGADFENMVPAITRFARSWEELRRGGGDLRSELLRINPGLERQLENARDLDEAIQILAVSFKGLQASEAQTLGRAAFGRNAVETVRLFQQELDIAALKQKALADNKLIDRDEVLRTAKAFDDINAKWAAIGSTIKKAFDPTITQAYINQMNNALDVWQKVALFSVRALENLRTAVGAKPPVQFPPFEGPEQPSRGQSIEARAKAEQERLQFLGQAATFQERFTGTVLNNAAAVEKNLTLQKDLNRVNQEAKQTLELQTLAAREHLGIATQEDILRAKQIENTRLLNAIRASETDKIKADTLARKEAFERSQDQIVKASFLPQLQRAAFDATNWAKQIDTLAVSSINHLTDAIFDAASGAKSFGDAFKDLSKIVLQELAKMLIKMALFKALSPFTGGLSSAAGGLIPLSITPAGRMAGGPVAGGTPYVVGERGPELFMPGRAGFVMPNSAMGRSGMSPVNFSGGINVDARGASPGVGLEIIRALRAEMPGIALATVAQAQRYGTLRPRR